MKTSIACVLAIWFGLVFLLGANGAFVRQPQSPPLPILIAASAPLIAFIAAYLGSIAFKEYVLSANIALLTAVQAWRAGGLGFLALGAHGVLPSLFAWPAGLGDVAIGVTAPWMAQALIRQPSFSGSRLIVQCFYGQLTEADARDSTGRSGCYSVSSLPGDEQPRQGLRKLIERAAIR